MIDISHIQQFLLCETPQAWIDAALAEPELLLIDHASCELKAAQTAQSIMWKYGIKPNVNQPEKKAVNIAINRIYEHLDSFDLMNKMSKLAREELRHFEQVLAIMKKRGIEYLQIDAARYAGELRKKARTSEPEKLVDTLIIGAIIEARSCERFAKLATHLDDELKSFYFSLLKSEARHYEDYLSLAKKASKIDVDKPHSFENRVGELLEAEKTLILSEDQAFRFHSGPLPV